MVPLSTKYIFPKVARFQFRVHNLWRPTCMRSGATRTLKSVKSLMSPSIWNETASIRLSKLGVARWFPGGCSVSRVQSSTAAFLCYVRAMELFSGGSKNGNNETAKMPKIGPIFRHKISYLEKYSKDCVARSNRTWCYKCLTPPIIGHTGELTILPNESARNFNLRK